MIKDTDPKEVSKSFKAKRFLRDYDCQGWAFSGLIKMACFFFSTCVFFPGVVKGWVGCSDAFPACSDVASIESSTARYSVVNGIHILQLEGSHYEMGLAYGKLLSSPLRETLRVIKAHFINDFGLSMEALYRKAFQFHKRYSSSYELFLEGMAEGAHLSLEECIVLNGMETLNSLKREKDIAHCAFIAIPPVKTAQASTLVGRNYDFPPPYEDCAKHIVVTVLKEENKVTTAIIGMPGQIYCPTCINREGLFLELNNGMPSGGYEVDYSRKSLLICLLEVLQDSSTLEQLRERLSRISADYSLIVNAASVDNSLSFEFSSTLGHQEYKTPSAEPFVSTNYFQSSNWSDIPSPTDDSTWFGVTRRENLLNLANALPMKATVFDLMAIMNQRMNEGGARWELTIYQVVFDTDDFSLYICQPNALVDLWTRIDLGALFDF